MMATYVPSFKSIGQSIFELECQNINICKQADGQTNEKAWILKASYKW